jgi:regulator of nucleoside diphosphate kinase
MSAMLQAPREAGALLQEVDRASVVDDPELGRDVVRVGSWVDFTDKASGEVRTVRLVAEPGDAASSDDVPALSNLGAALIGLRVGQSIVWPDRVGTELVLTVVSTGGTDQSGGASRAGRPLA